MSLSYKDHRRRAALARFVRKTKAAAYNQARDDLLRDLYERGKSVAALWETRDVDRPVRISQQDILRLDFRQLIYRAAQGTIRPGYDEHQAQALREDAVYKLARHMVEEGLMAYERTVDPGTRTILHTWRAFVAREER